MSRDVDLYLLGDGRDGLVSLEIPETDALVGCGPAVAVQKFLSCFFTHLGSVANDPNYGSPFLLQLVSGQLSNESAVTMAFSACVHDVLQYLAGSRDPASPADEEIARVTATRVTVTSDTVAIKATLTTLAGNSFAVTVPFKL